MKNTKRSLFFSITALILCCALLAGTTMAWFTDSVSSGVNTITAGNLDIEVSYKEDGNWVSIQDKDTLFSSEKWEPGHTEFVTLKVENKGTLALNYKVLVTPVTENGGVNVAGESFKLSDYLVFGTTTPSGTQTTYTRETVRAAVGATTGLSNANSLTKSETMNPRDIQYLDLVIYMPETVGNVANYKTGTEAPTIKLGINVVATQKTQEEDSFGTDYDAGAETDSFYTVGAYYDYYPQVSISTPVAASGNTVITATGKLNKDDENSITLAKVTVPEGATLVAGTTELTVNVVPKKPNANTTNGTALVTEINNPNRETSNFDVKVEGIASNNQANIDVEIFVGKGLSNVKVYHNGALIDGSSYNAATGIVTFTTTSFSDYTVAYDVAAAAIGDKTYGLLETAFNEVKDNGTIILLKDVKANHGFRYASDANATLDLARHTLTVTGSNGNDGGRAIQITGGSLTIKNGTIDGRSYGEDGKPADNPSSSSPWSETRTGGAVRVSGGDCTLENLVMYNNDGWGNAVKVETDNTLTMKNCTINSVYGAGLEVGNGTANLYNCTFKQEGVANNSYISTCIAVCYGGTINLDNACEATGTHALYVYNSGGTINIHDGNFTGSTAVLKADDSTTTAKSIINVYGGKFTGAMQIGSASELNITGGTFTSDPNEFCADGHGVIKEGNVYKVITGSFAKSEAELNALLATGGTVYLAEDMTLANSHTIPENTTIDCLGHTVTVSNLGAFSGKNFTIKNGILKKGTAWGFAPGSCTLENCVFNDISPYIVPSMGVDIVVKGCTFNDTMLQICWPEGQEKDPTKHTTTITGNTFNYTSTDKYNHVIALNADDSINYSKVEVANNTFNNSGTPAFGAYYLSDAVDSRGCISINYHDNKETNVTVGYRDQAGTYQKVTEDNAIYAVYEDGRKVLAKVTADYTGETFDIPDGVVAIGDWAFTSSTVKKVTVPASVTDLGRGFDTSSVEEVVLPEGLTTISSRAFRKTPNLKTLAIPSTVTTIVENAFQQAGITEITIPESVTSIEFGAFRDCMNLKTVTIQGNPTIANYAFRACPELTDVYLKGSDVKFGEGISIVFSTQENNNNNSKITIHVINEAVKERVDAIKGSGVPYNIVMNTQ